MRRRQVRVFVPVDHIIEARRVRASFCVAFESAATCLPQSGHDEVRKAESPSPLNLSMRASLGARAAAPLSSAE